MQYTYSDGGRRAAGFTGDAGDCVVRAVAIVADLPYREVYDALSEGSRMQRVTRGRKKSSARNGVNTNRKWFRDYMKHLGFAWTATMGIGTGCRVHLRADELPSGRLVVAVSKHYTAVIDGVIYDTHNPSADRGTWIYPPTTPAEELPKGAHWLENGNGWAYAPERCVYGYWS